MTPDVDMNNNPWPEGSFRRGLTVLEFAMALVHIKGDWAEYAHTLGFASWASVLYPCLLCLCEKINWTEVRGVSLLRQPWPEIGPIEYESACSACEVKVTIASEAAHRSIRVCLVAHK